MSQDFLVYATKVQKRDAEAAVALAAEADQSFQIKN
jgi:hypothetical protein